MAKDPAKQKHLTQNEQTLESLTYLNWSEESNELAVRTVQNWPSWKRAVLNEALGDTRKSKSDRLKSI